ncbi:MAG: hypothetical protein ACP5EQ_06795 [Candidatus Cloacimonadia bacterium]
MKNGGNIAKLMQNTIKERRTHARGEEKNKVRRRKSGKKRKKRGKKNFIKE